MTRAARILSLSLSLSLVGLTFGTALAQTGLPVRQTIYNDTLDKVNRAPGEGEPLGLGQSVSLFNGGLQVLQSGSRRYPLPGGGAVGVTLAYNSANVRRDEVGFLDVNGQPVSMRRSRSVPHRASPRGSNRSTCGSRISSAATSCAAGQPRSANLGRTHAPHPRSGSSCYSGDRVSAFLPEMCRK